MKSLKKLLAIVFLLTIVVGFSGCIKEKKKTQYSEGVAITSFNAPTEVDSNEQFTLDLIAQNIGDAEAKAIQADLFQRGSIQLLSDRVQKSDKLLPPVPEKDIQGEETLLSWELQAPILKETETKSLQARLFYDYTSTATSNLYLVPKAEYDEKGSSAFPTYSTSSSAPVTLSVLELPAFKTKPGQETAVVQISLEIANNGAGRVDNSMVEDFVIILKGQGTTIDITSSCPDIVDGTLKLYGNDQSRAIRCEPELPATDSAVSYILEAGLSYTYFVDSNPLPITIKAAEGGTVASGNALPIIKLQSKQTCKVKTPCEVKWSASDFDGTIVKWEVDYCGATYGSKLTPPKKTFSRTETKTYQSPRDSCPFRATVTDNSGGVKNANSNIVITE